MDRDPEIDHVVRALRLSIGLLTRRLRQAQAYGELSLPETSALARLDAAGPTTATALAKLEQISPQSMGATLDALEARGLITRGSDPQDGRRIIVSATESGLQELWKGRNARSELLARALSTTFTRAELGQLRAVAPLLERLAHNI